MTVRTVLIAGSCALLAGCTFHGRRVVATRSEYATAERNPVTRATAQEPLEQNAIDYVSVKGAALDARFVFSGWEWRDVVRPALGHAERLELQQAYRECVWDPGLGPSGEPGQATITLGIKRREPPEPSAPSR